MTKHNMASYYYGKSKKEIAEHFARKGGNFSFT